MNKNAPSQAASAADLFADLPCSPRTHFKVYLFGAILGFLERLVKALGSFEEIQERLPFLIPYNNELANRLDGMCSEQALPRWWEALEAWERQFSGHLPVRALRQTAQLPHDALALCLQIGLTEVDSRFGAAFELLQGIPGQRRATVGLFRSSDGLATGDEPCDAIMPRLRELGLVQVLNPEAPRLDWALQVPGPIWDAFKGEQFTGVDWLKFRPPEALLLLNDLIVSAETSALLKRLPPMLQSGHARVVVIRGPRHNGRRTALGAIARAMGLGILEIAGIDKPDDERWRQVGSLSRLLHALPLVQLDPGPGETVALPDLRTSAVPLGVLMGHQGGLSGHAADESLSLTLPMPDANARRRCWERCLVDGPSQNTNQISDRFRMTSGHIHRAARLAMLHAELEGRTQIEPNDVLHATRTLNRQALDTLARRVPAVDGWDRLCVSEETLGELLHLERRCQYREDLVESFSASPGGLNCGVRALLSGPSGTGKTLAARVLAASLQKDLYRIDLSAIVNKFIGETEKNLNRILECAEELDVILLLDEGDALLTQRTQVRDANDRYANLETNFLLQRLESFAGILIVTTNARNRIDQAFERRMDVVVEFSLPDAEQRWHLWLTHLPKTHRIEDAWLGHMASRCELSGGQIRNAALHAAILARDNGGFVTTAYVESAVRREYVKESAVCPLPQRA